MHDYVKVGTCVVLMCYVKGCSHICIQTHMYDLVNGGVMKGVLKGTLNQMVLYICYVHVKGLIT